VTSTRPGAIALAMLWVPAALAAPAPAREAAAIRGPVIGIVFDAALATRVVARLGGGEIELGPFLASEFVRAGGRDIQAFAFSGKQEEPADGEFGRGTRLVVRGRDAGSGLEKRVAVSLYDDFPSVAVFEVRYANGGASELTIEGWTNNHHVLSAGSARGTPAFWSYQPGTYESRPDWVLPLRKGRTQQNFLGMNAADYGGGTPVADVWRRDVGLAVGHLARVPKLVSLPVAMPTEAEATLAVSWRGQRRLQPGESLDTLRTFVSVHRGDHFATLRDYAALMARQGVRLPEAPASAFEPIWCAWGYGRDFTVDQVVGTLPVAKRLGFRWATLDDGWQVAEGDWIPNPAKFPSGDAAMRELVDRIHAQGFRAQLWWTPLAVDPGTPLHREHPDQLLLGLDGTTQKISWWDSLYLCPGYAPVRADAQAFARKALGEWGFDGLKIDGQHLNGVAPCANPAHGHASPEDSVEAVPEFFRAIYDAAQATRPGALVEICPCGTGYSFFTLPYLNMTVASDPESSWQVRLKAKTLKALVGDKLAYFGDHVELSEHGTDFASSLGVGAVVGSNFAWPGAPGKKDAKLLLTPERETAWGFWVKLYQDKRLSQGEYLGTLYDIGFDRPEAHVIRKDGALYYAFYAKRFAGSVELRGLGAGRYRVRDYEHDRDLGPASGPTARLAIDFREHLLLEARPE